MNHASPPPVLGPGATSKDYIGVKMPLSESNCGRRHSRRNNYKFNGLWDDRVQNGGLVSGTRHFDKINVYGPKAIYPARAVSHNDIKPRNTMNGCVNNGFRSNRYEMTQECAKAKLFQCSCSTLVNGSRSPGGPLSTTICGQEPAKPEKVTATKIQRKKKKHCHKKRNIHVAHFENCVPHPTEDWDDEIQEVKISNWGEMSLGTQPYGPEDVVNFCLRNLSLERSHPPLWQVTCNKYFPASHHQPPIEWSRYKPCSEPGQFSDVED